MANEEFKTMRMIIEVAMSVYDPPAEEVYKNPSLNELFELDEIAKGKYKPLPDETTD
jgi:hypothetical protein